MNPIFRKKIFNIISTFLLTFSSINILNEIGAIILNLLSILLSYNLIIKDKLIDFAINSNLYIIKIFISVYRILIFKVKFNFKYII
jgi:hypothetical protein